MKFEEVIEKKVIDEKIQGDVLEIHNKITKEHIKLKKLKLF